ncbi:helix-turn-helix transcriptional regulator [Clostridium sp. ASF356]|nr:helix-turn-helix transcriptional regulator [Clostridium sp. MD294]
MSQKQLAKKVAVSATMVSYIETGVKSVSVKTLYLMSKALDCTTDELLKGNEKSVV